MARLQNGALRQPEFESVRIRIGTIVPDPSIRIIILLIITLYFYIRFRLPTCPSTSDRPTQMFSRFSKKLARCDAFTLPTLSRMITKAYTPKLDVQHLDELYDFKQFCMDGDGTFGRVLAPLNNISFNHVFLIKKCDESANQTLLYAKQYTPRVHNGSHKRGVSSC